MLAGTLRNSGSDERLVETHPSALMTRTEGKRFRNA
jgi:hypothetical protein